MDCPGVRFRLVPAFAVVGLIVTVSPLPLPVTFPDAPVLTQMPFKFFVSSSHDVLAPSPDPVRVIAGVWDPRLTAFVDGFTIEKYIAGVLPAVALSAVNVVPGTTGVMSPLPVASETVSVPEPEVGGGSVSCAPTF